MEKKNSAFYACIVLSAISALLGLVLIVDSIVSDNESSWILPAALIMTSLGNFLTAIAARKKKNNG